MVSMVVSVMVSVMVAMVVSVMVPVVVSMMVVLRCNFLSIGGDVFSTYSYKFRRLCRSFIGCVFRRLDSGRSDQRKKRENKSQSQHVGFCSDLLVSVGQLLLAFVSIVSTFR